MKFCLIHLEKRDQEPLNRVVLRIEQVNIANA